MDYNLPVLESNLTVQEDVSSLDKLTQSYLMLKHKIAETHELIKQYNDKLKECEKLKQDLEAANKQTKQVTCNYNITLAKLIKLELQSTEHKNTIQTLTTQLNDSKIKEAADQQHIQQLICKIKDVEKNQTDKIMQYDLEKASLQVKIKELEQELKNVKKSYDSRLKKAAKKLSTENEIKVKLKDAGTNTLLLKDIPIKKSQTMEKGTLTDEFSNFPLVPKVKLKDIGTNTTLIKEIIIQKPRMVEKYTLTDEFYNIKEQPYPIFCGKCEILLEPPPLEKICQIMSNSCPKLIEKIPSPQKRASSPIRPSINTNSNTCKLENLPGLSDAGLTHLQNLNNHTGFISTNLLPPHAVSLNQSDFCNNYNPPHSLINHGAYYIGSAPINPLPITNGNRITQNSHCESMSTMASSLSIISSLQKRIDTLETKIKKKFLKKKSEEGNTCSQHCHPNVCHMYDANNSMQLNFMEMWQRMIDFYENRNRKVLSGRKTSRKEKSARLKIAMKRLQTTHRDSWKVESIAKEVIQSSPRKKSKKLKYLFSKSLNKSQSMLNDAGSSEKLDSDCDTSSNVDLANDFDDSKLNLSVMTEDMDCVQISVSETMDCNVKHVEEIVPQNSEESAKSVGGEIDSGILSDSIESGRLPLDAELAICPSLKEGVDRISISSSKEREKLELCKYKDVGESLIKAPENLRSRGRQTHTNATLSLSQSREEHVEENEQNSVLSRVRISDSNIQRPVKKRKLNEPQVLKKCGNRKDLLKKLRNLKKNKAPVKVCQSMLEQHDEQKSDTECQNSSLEQKDIDCKLNNINSENSIPKKRSRIAHVPKMGTINEKKTLNDALPSKKSLTKCTDYTIPQNVSNNYLNMDESRQESNELPEIDNNRIQEAPCSITSKNINFNSENKEKPFVNVPELSDSKIKSLLDLDTSNHDQTVAKSDISNCSIEASDQNDPKTKFTDQNEQLEFPEGNSSLDLSKTSETNDMDDLGTEHSITTLENVNNNKKINFVRMTKAINAKAEYFNIDDKVQSDCPIIRLQQYISESKHPTKNCKNQFRKLVHVRLVTDKFVQKQLQRLIDSNWYHPVHCDVIEKLSSTCTDRIIAKGIVDFLSSEEECTKSLDKSHTPPAPLMTRSQQQIVALLIDLEGVKPTIFELVQTGIEYRLFRLNQTTKRSIMESLARIYTVLTRIKKDREKARMFCCAALYCLGLNAIIILYTVLTCWPEVFPNNESNNKLLCKCMAHVVMTQQAIDFPKHFALKNLLSVFYKYPMGTLSKDILTELLTALQEKPDIEIETAIILLAKKEGTAWSYKNIIKGALLPMIINKKHPNTYRAFSLLGNLMRVFPTEDKDNAVGEIVEQLCDLINSGEGSDEQKEGIISALLSLSRHKFDMVVQTLLKWTPNASLRSQTREQIDALFNCKLKDFWKGYLKKNKHLMDVQTESKVI